MLWGKEKYLLNSLYEKLKKKVKTNESVSSNSKQIKVKYKAVGFSTI